jgi:hypothetical protein
MFMFRLIRRGGRSLDDRPGREESRAVDQDVRCAPQLHVYKPLHRDGRAAIRGRAATAVPRAGLLLRVLPQHGLPWHQASRGPWPLLLLHGLPTGGAALCAPAVRGRQGCKGKRGKWPAQHAAHAGTIDYTERETARLWELWVLFSLIHGPCI